MSLLHKLWDETVAGPAPESGLGKLRKQDSFSAVRSSPSVSGDNVTRSITVLKGNNNGSGLRNLKMDPGRLPDSRVGSSDPGTPLTPGTPGGFGGPFAIDKKAHNEVDATTLNAYDWIVINALDR